MRKLLKLMVGASALIFAGAVFANDVSPVGYWKTIDDKTGRAQSIIKITLNENDRTYDGKIVNTFPKPGEDKSKVCSSCSGKLRNKRILGMTIMHDFKADKQTPGYYTGGRILDPLSGSTYRCTMQVSPDNKKLTVRGYIGIPLFGRSQTWLRAKNIKGVSA